jgi:Cu2+-exporting ATPase
MLLINLLIIGGAFYTGRKINKKLKKQKKSYKALATEIIIKRKTRFETFSDKTVIPIVENTLQKITPFSDDIRSQQIEDISSFKDKNNKKSAAEKKLDKYITISLLSLGISATARLVYPPLVIISLPGLLYLTTPFFQGAYRSLFKEHRIKVDVVDTAVIVTTLVTGQYVACSIAYSLFLLSRKLLLKTEDHSQQSFVSLFGQQNPSVWILSDNVEIEIPIDALKTGDIVVVNAGETIPIDGIIIKGVASIDQHILTGESQAVEKSFNDKVFASTLILMGRIYIKVEKTGVETTVAKISQVLSHTADYKETVRSQSEAIVNALSFPILCVGTLALFTVGPIGAAAVMTSSLSLDTRAIAPTVMLNFLTLASRKNILIKDGRVLDQLNQVDTLIFDKTGTLTSQTPHVGQIYSCLPAEYEDNEILQYAAAAEYKQTHPVALAILEEASIRQLKLPEIDEAEYKVGYGITVHIKGRLIRVGSSRFMEMENIPIPSTIKEIRNACDKQGHSQVMVAIDTKLVGIVELHPTVRPEAKEVIQQLRPYFKSIYIISGDQEIPTKKLAETLGIDHYFSETLPEDKANIISKLQKEGNSVCYVGDGINDSIALKKATVSISLQGASTIATDTAQIILMKEELHQLTALFELAKHYKNNMNKSLFIKMVPSIIGVPGALFFNLNLTMTVMLNTIGLIASLGNAMHPLRQLEDSTNQSVDRNSD